MNKKLLLKYFHEGGKIRITSPVTHKYYSKSRKAEKIQTQSLRLEGGSWIYYKDINPENIFSQGFKMRSGLEEEFIYYAFEDMGLIESLGGLK